MRSLSPIALALVPSCLCPPSNAALLEVGYRTPVQTFHSWQTFVRADLPLREYQCFSADFRRRNGLSATTYGEGRERLLKSKPWLKWIAKAEVVREGVEGERSHWIEARVLGRTIRVSMVREGFYELWRGDELLSDEFASLDDLTRVAEGPRGARLSARLDVELAPSELAGLTEVTLAAHWKIDEFREVDGDAVPDAQP